MQTLTFNTTTKQVQLLDGPRGSSGTSSSSGSSTVIESFNNVSTVKVNVAHYEIMQKVNEDSNSTYPVMRVPISNTNMIIVK
jgi:hypothetical protein